SLQAVLDEVAGANLTPLAMDVRDEADACAKIAAKVEKKGAIEICVPNAGIAEGKALHKTDMGFWRDMMATNLDGVFLTIRESLTSMRQTDWGRVIAISSVAGLKGLKGAPCYSATKHGVIGLIRALSEDYLGQPITFNAICPAYVDTPIIARNTDSIAQRTGLSEDKARGLMVDMNRHGRLIEPEEIAAAALWLVRPGSESVNGQALEIAGGQM
ncbi:MAG: SDR family NAD(P)-dependent oxidoreductase, partial [Tateyamaria sp.]